MATCNRFGSESVEKISEAIENYTPKNTKRSKNMVWNQFTAFCEVRKYVLCETTSLDMLASILTDWAFNMKKRDGLDYKESVVKVIWNSTAKQIQQLFYNKYKIKFDPFTDITFKCARDAKNTKRRKLQVDINKRKQSSSAISKDEYAKIINLWSEENPIGLQRKFYHIAAYELCWRGGEGANCLVNYFHEEQDNSGNLTGRIEYNPLFSKSAQGGDKKLTENKWIITNLSNLDACPVR